VTRDGLLLGVDGGNTKTIALQKAQKQTEKIKQSPKHFSQIIKHK